MATYVVDASVSIQCFITQTYTPQAKILVEQLAEGDQLYIPEFCVLECANVFWKEVRFRGMHQAQAERMVHQMLALPLQMQPVYHLLPQALEIGLAHQLAVYDSLYIALALSLECPLVTVDDRQSQAAIAVGTTAKLITDFSDS